MRQPIKLIPKVKKNQTNKVLNSISKRTKESRITKLFKEDEDLSMIKQNLDFSNSDQIIDLMGKVLKDHSDILNPSEIKVIKKQLR
jgi:hypothetical protein